MRHDENEQSCCHAQENQNIPSWIENIKRYLSEYKPLIVIIIFCLVLSLVTSYRTTFHDVMYYFMGYFFVFLSLFKFFDLVGFVNGFSTYDLIAKRCAAYGYAYPFIEFLLGVAYLSQYNILLTNCLTVVVMLIGGAGVIKSVLSGQKVKCACLGTVLNVPLSTVSIIENFGMAIMALYKLITHIAT